jgi:hypothetical protein
MSAMCYEMAAWVPLATKTHYRSIPEINIEKVTKKMAAFSSRDAIRRNAAERIHLALTSRRRYSDRLCAIPFTTTFQREHPRGNLGDSRCSARSLAGFAAVPGWAGEK